MKAMVGVVALACAVGCNVESPQSGEVSQAATVGGGGVGSCLDPSQPCTLHNGGGIYTEEHGNAHVGYSDFMIMRFVNQTGGGVTLFGRGDTGNGVYDFASGSVLHAYYNGGSIPIPVYSIEETGTLPTVRLGPPGLVANTVAVTGDAITNLKLVVTVPSASGTTSTTAVGGRTFTLGWFNPALDPNRAAGETSRGLNQTTLHTYLMTWADGDNDPGALPKPYCERAPLYNSDPDPVIFQQGIGVQPLTADMGRNNAYVTLSCRHGAIATAYWWGYSYLPDSAHPYLFDSAMKMKRASYCGDASFYTFAGTEILIHDTLPNIQEGVDSTNIEALWGMAGDGRIRALCVSNRRHPYLKFESDFYDPTCRGAVPAPGIPSCDGFALDTRLASAPAN